MASEPKIADIPGLKKVVHKLWESEGITFYRVNFHDPNNQNKIARSAWVKEKDGELTYSEEEQKKKEG